MMLTMMLIMMLIMMFCITRYEQSVLTSILGSQDGSLFWTGLSDVEKPGQYRWSDNTAVTLTNWDYAQPGRIYLVYIVQLQTKAR